jgi:hypothetical protein
VRHCSYHSWPLAKAVSLTVPPLYKYVIALYLRVFAPPKLLSSLKTMATLSISDRALIAFFKVVNKVVAWHKLPRYIGVFNLLAFRLELQAKNLYDVYPDAGYQGTAATCPMKDSRYVTARNSDGVFNSLEEPSMGCAGMRFGRNVPRENTKKPTDEELMTPSPRLVSDVLLKRTGFKPATIVNLLAAAWIQFQIHDWFFHEQVCFHKQNPTFFSY